MDLSSANIRIIFLKYKFFSLFSLPTNWAKDQTTAATSTCHPHPRAEAVLEADCIAHDQICSTPESTAHQPRLRSEPTRTGHGPDTEGTRSRGGDGRRPPPGVAGMCNSTVHQHNSTHPGYARPWTDASRLPTGHFAGPTGVGRRGRQADLVVHDVILEGRCRRFLSTTPSAPGEHLFGSAREAGISFLFFSF